MGTEAVPYDKMLLFLNSDVSHNLSPEYISEEQKCTQTEVSCNILNFKLPSSKIVSKLFIY